MAHHTGQIVATFRTVERPWIVTNARTGSFCTSCKTKAAARKAVDRLDAEYGAAVHRVHYNVLTR